MWDEASKASALNDKPDTAQRPAGISENAGDEAVAKANGNGKPRQKLYELRAGNTLEREGYDPVTVSTKQRKLLRLLQTRNPLPAADAYSKKPDAPWHGRYNHERHFENLRRAVNRLSQEKLSRVWLEAKICRDDATIRIYAIDGQDLDRK